MVATSENIDYPLPPLRSYSTPANAGSSGYVVDFTVQLLLRDGPRGETCLLRMLDKICSLCDNRTVLVPSLSGCPSLVDCNSPDDSRSFIVA